MGVLSNNRSQITAGGLISASFVSDLYDILTGTVEDEISISGSLHVTGSIYGNLIGTAETASYILNAVSSSYAETASYSLIASESMFSISSSYSITASYCEGFIASSSYAETASYAVNSVSSSYATTSNFANTASYIETAQTASYVLNAVSASLSATASYVNGVSASIQHVNITDHMIVQGTILFYTASLPETDPEINGQLWRSGSFLMISTGSGI
jgi:hypothetical protein